MVGIDFQELCWRVLETSFDRERALAPSTAAEASR
jgi:hypothetical protein